LIFEEGRRKKEEGRRKKEEGRRKKEEGRRKREWGMGKKEEVISFPLWDSELYHHNFCRGGFAKIFDKY